MSDQNVAVRVSDLSKCYQIYDSPRDRLKQFVFPKINSLFKQVGRNYFTEFWALKNISLHINKGKTVGIIGQNGSGKSTLLQIICGTLNQTCGSILTNGRIAALLELGSGFNFEFSGRENVFMYGAVLGLSQDEIEARFSDIESFADIGQFMGQPLKTYSSGMIIRLAFSVAIHVEPEILIVDEALSVGDELFQRKCYSRIEEIKKSGATILFVSHSISTVLELCDYAVLLDSGELLASGKPKVIVGLYQKLIYAPPDEQVSIREEINNIIKCQDSHDERYMSVLSASIEPDNIVEQVIEETLDQNLTPLSTLEYVQRGARIEAPKILTLSGGNVNCLNRGNIYRYVYSVKFDKKAFNVRFAMLIKTSTGLELGGAVSESCIDKSISIVEASSQVNVEFEFVCNLNPGLYFLNAGVTGFVNDSETYLHRIIDAYMFRVMPIVGSTATAIVDFKCRPNYKVLSRVSGSRVKLTSELCSLI